MVYRSKISEMEAELVTLGGQEVAVCHAEALGHFVLPKEVLDRLYSCLPSERQDGIASPHRQHERPNWHKTIAGRLWARIAAEQEPVKVSWMVEEMEKQGMTQRQVFDAKTSLANMKRIVKTEAEDGVALWSAARKVAK